MGSSSGLQMGIGGLQLGIGSTGGLQLRMGRTMVGGGLFSHNQQSASTAETSLFN